MACSKNECKVLDVSAREAAVGRYQKDESDKLRKDDDVYRSRSSHPMAMLLGIPIDYMGAARKYIEGGTSWWIAISRVLVCIPVDLLEVVGDFAYAHAWLWVGSERRDARAKHCEGCSYRKHMRHDGKLFPASGEIERLDFCTVDDSCNGTCPRVSWWRPASLGYRLWMRWFKCPAGRFD